MKRRLISMFMVLCMIITAVPLLTGCESGEGVDDVTHRRAVTLVIYYIVEDGTTPEAIEAVQRELSLITEARFTTRIELRGLTASEYEDAIDRAFAAFDEEVERQEEAERERRSLERVSREQARADREAGIPTVRTPRPTEPPRTTALFTERIEYPDVQEDQIDIFFINSDELFLRLADEGRMAQLDDEMNTRAKILREYIHPSVLEVGRHHGRTFAIPTNRVIGEGTWIAVNTRLAEQYGLDTSRIRDWRDLTEWLEEIRENEPNIAMVEGGPFAPLQWEPLIPEFGPYFPIQATRGQSVVFTPEQMPTEPLPPAATEPPTDEYGNLIIEESEYEYEEEEEEPTIPPTTLPPRPIPARLNMETDSVSVSNQYAAMMWNQFAQLNQHWRDAGLFATSPAPDYVERAAHTIRGTLEDKLMWEAAALYHGFEYEFIMIQRPTANRVELRSAMFAVSVSTPNVGRAMEVVTMLNTNRQFKNIFTYGVQGEHFMFNEDGQIVRLNYDYMVDIANTGNKFIADLLAGENPRKWNIGMEHNLLIANSVFLREGFDISRLPDDAPSDFAAMNALGREVRDAFLNGIPAGFEDLDDYISNHVNHGFDLLGVPELLRAIREILAE